MPSAALRCRWAVFTKLSRFSWPNPHKAMPKSTGSDVVEVWLKVHAKLYCPIRIFYSKKSTNKQLEDFSGWCKIRLLRSLNLDGARALLPRRCVVSHWTLMVCLLHAKRFDCTTMQSWNYIELSCKSYRKRPDFLFLKHCQVTAVHFADMLNLFVFPLCYILPPVCCTVFGTYTDRYLTLLRTWNHGVNLWCCCR